METLVPSDVLRLFGPSEPRATLVLDSPHSGFMRPSDFDTVLHESDWRDGEDSYIDELYRDAMGEDIPLLAAQFPRTYLDANRSAEDLDPALMDEIWPSPLVASKKAELGKALLWRTLDDGRPIYARKLKLNEVQHRIKHYHQPYHQTLKRLLDATHARFGVVHHFNCHSMNPVAGAMGEGGAGTARADFVLGDRDGTTCAPEVTAFVRDQLRLHGYDVRVNDPFKGVELVRAYADPAAGRHSLQVEINKRLYMNVHTREKTEGFVRLQGQLAELLRAFRAHFHPTA